MNVQLCKPARFPPRNRVVHGALMLGVLGLTLLGGCAPPPRNTDSRVALLVLPKAPDGHVGAVMVRPLGTGKAVLVNKPYVEASLGDTKTVRMSPIDSRT